MTSGQASTRLGSFVGAVGALVALVTLVIAGPSAALSAAAGAALAFANFQAWRWLVGRMLARRVESGPPLTLLLAAKALLGLGVVGVLLALQWVAPLPFLCGLSALLPGLVLGSAWLVTAEPSAEGEG